MGLNVMTMVECAVWNVSMLINMTDTSPVSFNFIDSTFFAL